MVVCCNEWSGTVKRFKVFDHLRELLASQEGDDSTPAQQLVTCPPLVSKIFTVSSNRQPVDLLCRTAGELDILAQVMNTKLVTLC